MESLYASLALSLSVLMFLKGSEYAAPNVVEIQSTCCVNVVPL